jgi:hypothetical protein
VYASDELRHWCINRRRWRHDDTSHMSDEVKIEKNS